MTLLCKAFLPESFKAIEVQRGPRCQLLLKSKNGPSREVSSLIDYMPAGPLRSRDVEIEHSCRVDCAYSISHRRVLGGARQDEPSHLCASRLLQQSDGKTPNIPCCTEWYSLFGNHLGRPASV